MEPSQDTVKSHRIGFSRREFLRLGCMTAFSCVVPLKLFAAVPLGISGRKSLSFYNTHTEEFLKTAYLENGEYQSDALDKINHILRDHRNGEIKPIDLRLLEALHLIHQKIPSNQPFHVISAYRSPETNSYLRSQSRGVARKSYHMLGQAVDFRLPGYPLSKLRQVTMGLQLGGVGYYPSGDFIHVDVGPIRCW
jgi:uncharacterized protein YcbK (DUF882 family)